MCILQKEITKKRLNTSRLHCKSEKTCLEKIILTQLLAIIVLEQSFIQTAIMKNHWNILKMHCEYMKQCLEKMIYIQRMLMVLSV